MKNATTTQNTETATVTRTKYINDSATADRISEILEAQKQELNYTWFLGPVRVWINVPLPGGGTSLQQTIQYKLLRGTYTTYEIGSWTLINPDALNPMVEVDVEESEPSSTTSPTECDDCPMEDGGICFSIAHSDVCGIDPNESDPESESAPGYFFYRWNVTNVVVDDGSEGDPIPGYNYNPRFWRNPVNIAIGKRVEKCPENTTTCAATCGCDPCGKLGYQMDPSQCTALNREYRVIAFSDVSEVAPGLTCYECYVS